MGNLSSLNIVPYTARVTMKAKRPKRERKHNLHGTFLLIYLGQKSIKLLRLPGILTISRHTSNPIPVHFY